MAIILGLDVSSISTGWAILKHGRFYKREGVDYGIIKGNPKLKPANRLSLFRKEIAEIISKTKPDYIVIEDTFSGPNRKTFKVLCRFGGVAMEVSRTIGGVEPIIVPVTSLRAVWGTQVKKEIFNKVVSKYKLDHFEFDRDNDITDAIAIAWYTHRILRSN